MFDLQQFRERPTATSDDIALFHQLITELEEQPAEVSAPKAQAALRALPSNT